jgi:3-oxoacyl-[acyl-carrier protein] reductase
MARTPRSLVGSVVAITGGGRGIGRATALALIAQGARVAIGDIDAALAERTAEELGSGTIGLHLDVTDGASFAGFLDQVEERLGGLDILVNNAAIRRETPFAALTPVDWREVMGVILDGAYLCTLAALPHLQRSSMASIVNIGGLSGHTGSPGRAHVVAAKAGLAGLTRALAHDFGPDGITVNCVVPGLIDTVRGASATGGTPAMHGLHRPLAGRRGRPEEVAALVRFLCGPQARYLTGQTMHANGGAYLG